MVTVAELQMSEPKKQEGTCVYVSVKIDQDVLPRIKAVAGLQQKSVQDYLSDLTNEATSKYLQMKPVKRKPNKREE